MSDNTVRGTCPVAQLNGADFGQNFGPERHAPADRSASSRPKKKPPEGGFFFKLAR
jgi:hypothetical protein